jgi:membrane-bound lytic murein transglycosylase F
MKEGRMSVLIESGINGFTRDSLKAYGFQYEIIRRFADTIGVELVVINKGNEENGFDELSKNNCDVLVSLNPVMNDTSAEVMFLRPIITTRLMLVQQKDSSGMIPSDKQYLLDNQTITVMENSPFIPRLKDLSEELAITLNINEQNFSCLNDMIKTVAEKKNKYAICEEYLSGGLLKQYPQLDILVPLSFHQDLSWCVNRKSVKLHEKLNEFLDDFIGSQEYWQLYRRYFPEN